MTVQRQSAIVNGGAGGIGSATVRHLSRIGYGVVVFDPDADSAKALAESLDGPAVAVGGDQSSEADVMRAIQEALALGRFSVCVNVAGYVIPTPPTVTPDGEVHAQELFEEMVRNHLTGPFNMARLSAQAFAGNEPDEEGQRGVIINTASTAAYEGQSCQVAYSASKGGIASMTPTMARDLAPIRIRVCAIAPGPIMTPRLASAPPELKEMLISNVAFPRRFGRPEEYAKLVEAIINIPFLNGQVIRLDGAMSTPLTSFAARR